MKRVLTLSFLIVFMHQATAQQSDKEKIEEIFNNYRFCLYTNNGAEAVKYVDSNSIELYERMLHLAKNADSLKVASLPMLDKFMVLTVRSMIPKEKILKFDGRTFLVYAIDNGMIDKGNSTALEIGKVIVENNFAKGQIVAGGKVSPHYFHFSKEKGEWKFDLTSFVKVGAPHLEKMVEKIGENGIIKMIQQISKSYIQNPDIWQPVQ